MDSDNFDEESTGVSETTPLHVNTSNQTRTLHADALITTLTSSAPRVLSSTTIDSTITATTFASSSNTLNHVPSANGIDDPCGDSTSRLQQEVDHVRKQAIKSRIKTTTTLSILLLSLTLCFLTLMQYLMSTFRVLHNPGENDTSISSEEMHNRGIDLPTGPKHKSDKELFDEFGRYIIEDYDALPPFSDFLPGVAGIYGKPLWSFYVNRGQGIASFGVESKDSPIMEFFSANNAYQNTPLLGFRTFYKGHRGSGWGGPNSFIVEPFSSLRTNFRRESAGGQGSEKEIYPARTMYIGANDIQIREIDRKNKIETNVSFFVLPEEDFGAFVKRTTVSNLGEKKLYLSILDGLPRIQPVGGKLDALLKSMGRTLEGFMGVYEADGNTMPFYRLSTEAGDGAAVVIEEAGNFALSYIENHVERLLPIVYDTSTVFGEDTTLMRPLGLEDKTVKEIIDGPQYGAAKTSSAFSAVDDVSIFPGQSITVTTFYGRASKITDVPVIARRIAQGGFVEYKLLRARELVQQITAGVETSTKNKLFDAHVRQMYLDNSLRGGIPIILGEVDDRSRLESADGDGRIKVYHLFSRIHGDLERDYNNFVLSPTYFSQGPGNFRDVAQNRRNDVVINPRIGSFNVKMFLSLIQLDGYNPLSVEAVVFTIDDKNECKRLAVMAVGAADGHRKQRESLTEILCDGAFRPGQLARMIEEQAVFLFISLQEFIDNVAASSYVSPMAVSKDGFWADHWTYVVDLLFSFVHVFPDQEEHLLFDLHLSYFYNPRVCLPRSQKYVLSKTIDGKAYHVRQLKACREDPTRLKRMKKYVNNSSGWFDVDADIEHDLDGNIFRSTPIAKLFLLATLKFATRDPLGMGIEYECGKPGWNDAMNGLAGMIGSGMPETFELKVLLKYIQKVCIQYRRPIVIPNELAWLIQQISAALDKLDQSGAMNFDFTDTVAVPAEFFEYWDTVASARESYRNKTGTFSGQTQEYSCELVIPIVSRWLYQLDYGIKRAHSIGTHNADVNDNDRGIVPTYFSFTVTNWVTTGEIDDEGQPFVNATEMVVNKFPIFLEGVVRMMKTLNDPRDAEQIYKSVKTSGLHDAELGMYTLSASLKGQNVDMGRMMAFTPGWLENQAIWLHMSYKYYLEILRKGLYTIFFEEMQLGMLPFINAEAYGRSPVECSSFIASSAFDDPKLRGRGFLARLSGSTAEFLSMWSLMMIGPTPFFVNNETHLLEMQLVPAIPAWFFQEDATTSKGDHKYYVEFKLFTSIQVIYFSRESIDIFGTSPIAYEIGLRDGSLIRVDGPTIPNNLAIMIRRVVLIDCIHAYF